MENLETKDRLKSKLLKLFLSYQYRLTSSLLILLKQVAFKGSFNNPKLR